MRCPSCGNTGRFTVRTVLPQWTQIECTPAGDIEILEHEPDGDTEWNKTSVTSCYRCDYTGPMDSFERSKPLTQWVQLDLTRMDAEANKGEGMLSAYIWNEVGCAFDSGGPTKDAYREAASVYGEGFTVDDDAVVLDCGDEGGANVMGWRWVSRDDIEEAESE